MDAQGRGRADDIDPADQWVLNPDTGDYELRLSTSGEQSNVPGPRRAARAARRGITGGRPAAEDRETRGLRQVSAREAAALRGGDAEDKPAGTTGRRRRAAAAATTTRRGRRPQRSRTKKTLMWIGGTLAFVLIALASAGFLYYQHLNNNLNKVADDGAGTGGFSKDRAINVLLIGTDKRTGSGNEGYGDSGSPGHADTTLLLHVSKDRTNATALSIPRDMIVDIPACPTTQEDGSSKTIPGSSKVQFNQSLGQSGRTASCTMRTVTELTGIRMDHFMVADFAAIKTLTTAVGGVEVCLAKDINDDDSHLKLSKGKHVIQGEQALAFVRTRHSFGNRGDLDRIKQQQQFLGSLMRKLKSNDTLTDPTKMFNLAEAGTKALTVDSQISSIGKLRDLGMELGKFDAKNLTFVTTPVVDNPDRVTVSPVAAKAEQLFSMMREDVSLTEVKAKEKKEKAAQEKLLKGARSEASEVRVDLYNGGAKAGSASSTLTWLQNTAGVLKSSQLGNADAELDKTRLEYGPAQADQARKLADLMGLPASALKPGKSEKNAQGLPAMQLTLGKDFKGAGVPIAPPKKAPDDVQRVEADKQVCAE